MDAPSSNPNLPIAVESATGLIIPQTDDRNQAPSIRESFRSGQIPPPVPSSIDASGVETDCIICLEPFDYLAEAVPCGHRFDAGCIRRWMRVLDSATPWCPLCRTVIESLKHSFLTDETSCSVAETEAIVRGESVFPDMTAREIHLAREKSRLRRRAKVELKINSDQLVPEFAVKYKNYLATVRRAERLEVIQEGLETISTLANTLEISFEKMDSFRTTPPYRTDRKAQEAFQDSHGLVKMMTKAHINRPTTREAYAHEYDIELGHAEQERGLLTTLSRQIIIERRRPMVTSLSWLSCIREQGPANTEDDLPALPANSDLRERYDNIVEYMEAHKRILEYHGSERLDRATTMLLEGDSVWQKQMKGPGSTKVSRWGNLRDMLGGR